jgi:L-iditol 2-dehydrogenase
VWRISLILRPPVRVRSSSASPPREYAGATSSPLVLGHEFAGAVERCPADAVGGDGRRLSPGVRVAVDPAVPCMKCEMCLRGDTHICRALHFCGLSPDDGCFRERMVIPARSCFTLPDEIDDEQGALLEPLGVAMHARNRCRLMKRDTLAIFGAGPIGLLFLQVALRAGASSVYVVEPLPWRLALAARLGGIPIDASADPVDVIMEKTAGRGVDAVLEAAWADASVQNAVECVVPGGRIVLVGIPSDDSFSVSHSTGRRKELSLLFSRRMKATYPEAIQLVRKREVDLRCLITHRFPLSEIPAAFALNAAYRDGVVKVMIGKTSSGGV